LDYAGSLLESNCERHVLVQVAKEVAAFLFLCWVVYKAAPYVWKTIKFTVQLGIWIYQCGAEETRAFKEDFSTIAWWKKLTVIALAAIGIFYGSIFVWVALHIIALGSYGD